MPSSIGMPILNLLKILTPKDITRLSKQVKKIEKVQLTKILTEEMQLKKHHEEERFKQKQEMEKKNKTKADLEKKNEEELVAESSLEEKEVVEKKVEAELKTETEDSTTHDSKPHDEASAPVKKKKNLLTGQDEEEKVLTEQEKLLLQMSSTKFYLTEKEKGREIEKNSRKSEIIESYKEISQTSIQKEKEGKSEEFLKIGQTGILFNKKRF